MSTTVPDINDLSLLAEVIEGLNPSATPEDFFRVQVPDDGRHQVILALGQDGVTHKVQKSGKGKDSVYVMAHLAMKIDDPQDPAQGLMIFDRVTSIVFERSGTSALHAVMGLSGSPIPPTMTKGEVIEFVKVQLAQPTRVAAITQWQASSKAQTQDEVEKAITAGYGKKGKLEVGQYYTFLKGQKAFPSTTKEDGSVHYSSSVKNPITGEDVNAQAVVVRYDRPS